MYSFLISIVLLIVGGALYGKFIERLFGANPKRMTPARKYTDNVDFIPMPMWKVFMIQFLNIAGTGPIFGAIMGAMFGPSCFLWIVLGSIFAGGVHDYMSGMMSVRSHGQTIPFIFGTVFGKGAKQIMIIFSLILLLILGPVFLWSPSMILSNVAHAVNIKEETFEIWIIIIFIYYIVATIFPINKIIGRFYPAFSFLMLFMAVSLFVCLLVKWPSIPEFWDGCKNLGPLVGHNDQPIFPCLFITVACGAISGFHSTQSPLMARCLSNEKYGRTVFYNAMIAEGVVALVWAAVSSWFFFDGGMAEIGSTSRDASVIVASISQSWLGILGGFLAVIGVVVAPITSGDTAFRSARLIIADALKFDQKKISHRLAIAIPMFIAAFAIVMFNFNDSEGFNKIWRYFGFSNQALASAVLWCISVYLAKNKKNFSYLTAFIPACFMTAVCICFILVDKICIGLPVSILPGVCCYLLAIFVAIFFILNKKFLRKNA